MDVAGTLGGCKSLIKSGSDATKYSAMSVRAVRMSMIPYSGLGRPGPSGGLSGK